MRFIKGYTVRWHDTGACRTVTPSRILEFMQESASLHCRSLGHDLDEMRDKERRGFVVVRFSFEILSPLYAQDEITVETWVPEDVGLFFSRSYEIKRGGETVARGISVSALLDLDTRKFLRVSDVDLGFEPEPSVRLSDGVPLRLRFPEGLPLALVGERRIFSSDCDYNRHMNNTHYPDMLLDFLPEATERSVASMAISYVGEARLGDTLHVFVSPSEDGDDGVFSIRATRADGTTVTEARIVAPRITEPRSTQKEKNSNKGDTLP